MLGDELQHAFARGRELFSRRPTVRRARHGASLHLLAQAGDADLEELVEVAGEDRRELHPLEQRVPGVFGFEQDARVELEPGQLAVEVRELRTLAFRDPPWACRDGGRGRRMLVNGGHVDVRLRRAGWPARIAREYELPG